MKKSIFTLFTVFTVVVFTSVNAQSLDDVLENHFEAVGQEKLMDTDTYIIKARIEQMGQQLPMTMKMKRPDKFRMEMEMQGQKMVQVYDGEKGWVLAPWVNPEPQALEGPQLQQAMDQADIDGELYNYKAKGHSADLIGKVKYNDDEAFRIKLTTKDGIVKNYYIDADTYLVSGVKSKINAQGQEVEIEQIMSGYEKSDGIMIARKIESKTPMGVAAIFIEEVSFDQELNDSEFQKPE
ncbi:MAG: hypothetical protein ACOC1D_00515 [Prolixibacteraceae bacterium]